VVTGRGAKRTKQTLESLQRIVPEATGPQHPPWGDPPTERTRRADPRVPRVGGMRNQSFGPLRPFRPSRAR